MADSRPHQHNATQENPDNLPMTVASRFERVIGASLERVWENVRDWEHLPHLHAGSFDDIKLDAEGNWGWRARLKDSFGTPMVVELAIDEENRRYVSRTLEGPLPGVEIWTDLSPQGPHETGITVAFHLPHLGAEQAKAVGKQLAATYQTLWDEDEAMMQQRQQALDAARSRPPAELILGSEEEVRAALPLRIEWGGQPVRIVDHHGELAAFVALCPHMLGPLEEGPDEAGCITCPWHGYRFDLRTGRSADGRGLRLKRGPRLEVRNAQAVLLKD
ncbi:MAG: Rieske 2Fe-2S domain-containing protein [Alphaproteobacteria bacterium]|nr:Rieske 2Fe-2S domain-containing protein [Alphaproteobacteria bacterium]